MLLLTCMALQLLGASLSPSAELFPLYDPLPVTGVTFDTTDAPLRGLYHRAATLEPQNSRAYLTSPRFDVLIEGAEYIGAWIETQPMAGGMMAARDVRLALNAQLVFVRSQRSDGRLPHAVWPCLQGNCTATAQGTGLNAGWCLTLQGAYFASPAVDVAWFMRLAGSDNQADAYLAELAGSRSGTIRRLSLVHPERLNVHRATQLFRDGWRQLPCDAIAWSSKPPGSAVVDRDPREEHWRHRRRPQH